MLVSLRTEMAVINFLSNGKRLRPDSQKHMLKTTHASSCPLISSVRRVSAGEKFPPTQLTEFALGSSQSIFLSQCLILHFRSAIYLHRDKAIVLTGLPPLRATFSRRKKEGSNQWAGTLTHREIVVTAPSMTYNHTKHENKLLNRTSVAVILEIYDILLC